MQDSIRTIFSSAKQFFSGTLLSRLTGMLRDIVMAQAFGTHSAIAAFFVAFRLAHLFRRLLGEGPLQSAFIPLFEARKKTDPAKAGFFFQNSCLFLILLLSSLILFGNLFLGTLLLWGNFLPATHEVLFLTLLLLPSLLFICLYGLNSALLQCEQHYFTTSFAPVLFNLVWIVGVFYLKGKPPHLAATQLSFVIILACFSQWLLTVPQLISHLNLYGKVPKKKWLCFQEVKRLITPISLGIFGIAATQINSAVDVLFARAADPQGPAYLFYALRLQQLPLALFGIAIASALLPPLSRALQEGKSEKYAHFLRFSLEKALVFMLPITLFLLLYGDLVIHLLFGHGNFSTYSTLQTTRCLFGYAFSLLPMTLILILASAFYAQNDYTTPAKGATIALFLNTFFNSLFIWRYGLGAESIAFATSISSLVNCLFLGITLSKKLGISLFPSPNSDLYFACTAATLFCFTIAPLFQCQSHSFAILFGHSIKWSHTFLEKVIQLSLATSSFGGTFLLFFPKRKELFQVT